MSLICLQKEPAAYDLGVLGRTGRDCLCTSEGHELLMNQVIIATLGWGIWVLRYLSMRCGRPFVAIACRYGEHIPRY